MRMFDLVMMTLVQLTCLVLVASVWRIIEAQSLGRVRNVVPVALVEQCPPCSSCSSCTVDDLSTLLLLARALDDKPAPPGSGLDVEGIITKLINALVLTTTQNAGNGGTGSASQGLPATGGRNGNGQGLVNLDVLEPNGLLDLDVGGKKVADVDLGTSSSSSTNSASRSTGNSRLQEGKREGLVELDVLAQRPNDLARLNLAGSNIIDVNLGKGN